LKKEHLNELIEMASFEEKVEHIYWWKEDN